MKNETIKDQEQPVRIWPALMLAAWWGSFSWLALVLIVIVCELIWWLASKGDPTRYETVIVSMLVSRVSWPAGLGVLATGLVPRTGLSLSKRYCAFAVVHRARNSPQLSSG